LKEYDRPHCCWIVCRNCDSTFEYRFITNLKETVGFIGCLLERKKGLGCPNCKSLDLTSKGDNEMILIREEEYELA